MSVNPSTHFAPPLNRPLFCRWPLAFFNRTLSRPVFFSETPSPRIISVRCQKTGSDGLGSKRPVNMAESESDVSIGSSGSSVSSAIDFLTLCNRLKTTKRKGWINHGIKGPESIADHMYRMALMALIAGDLPGLNRERCIKIAIVHDIAEGEIQGAYQIKVTTSALALLLSTRHAELAKANVQGHLIKSLAGITTRSKAKSDPAQWTVVPLPAKILALLADTLIEIQEQVLDGDDEDSDWEEIQEREMESDKDFLSTGAASFGRPTYEQLEAKARVYDENQDEGDEDDVLSVADPLNEINLATYLADFILKFSHSDRQLFDNLCQTLTQAQRNAIQMVLRC